MNRSYLIVVVFFVAFSQTFAQTKEPSAASDEQETSSRGGGVSGEGVGLLRVPEVQNDLRLSQEQRVQILALSMEMKKTRLDVRKRLNDILDPAQLRRLKEIRLQVEGPAGMNTHEVAMSLGLSKEQRLELKQLQNRIGEQINAIISDYRGLPGDELQKLMPEILEKMHNIRTAATEQALEVLTPDQRDHFDQMQGKKLNLSKLPAQPE